MSTPLQRTINLLGAGSVAEGEIPKLLDACAELDTIDRTLTAGVAEFNRGSNGRQQAFQRDGITDISPAPEEIRNAAGFVGEASVAEANRGYWEASLHAMADRLIAVQQAAGLIDGQTLWFQSACSGHTKPADEALRDIRRRLPGMFLMATSVIPDEAYLREALQTDPEVFIRLKDDAVVETTFLMDNLAPLALAVGLECQDVFAAKGLATLLAAQKHFAKQRGFADIIHALGLYGAWFGGAFASRNIVAADEVRWWTPMRRAFNLPERAKGDLQDVLIAVRSATEDVLTNPTTQAIAEPAQRELQSFLALTIPLKRHDPRWTALAPAIKEWLAREHPTITPLFASGNGTPDPRFTSSYWVQASLFFPLPERPQALRRILERPSMRRRKSRQPEANGHHATPTRTLERLASRSRS